MTHPALASPNAKKASTEVNSIDWLLVNKSEAAELLRVSEKTLDKWITEFDLPCIQFGRSVRFSVEALKEWIAAQGNR